MTVKPTQTDIDELRALLQRENSVEYRLTPDEFSDIQDAGFLVVPAEDVADGDGKKLCVISLRLS